LSARFWILDLDSSREIILERLTRKGKSPEDLDGIPNPGYGSDTLIGVLSQEASVTGVGVRLNV
jgi:hypothetical protein